MPLFDVYLTGGSGQRIAGTRNTVAAYDKREALDRDEKLRGYHAGNRVAAPRPHTNGVYAPPPDAEPVPREANSFQRWANDYARAFGFVVALKGNWVELTRNGETTQCMSVEGVQNACNLV